MSKLFKCAKDFGTAPSHLFKQFVFLLFGDAKDAMKVTVNGEGLGTGGTVSKKIMVKKDDGTVLELTGAEADKWIAEHPGVPGEKDIVIKRVDGGTMKSGDTVIVRKADGTEGTATFTSKDGKTFNIDNHKVVMAGHGDMTAHHSAMKSNELLRTTLSLLLTAPKGLDVEYTYGGPGDIDGRNCNIVVASFGGQSFKLFLDRSSNLPVALSYKGMATPKIMTFNKEVPASPEKGKDVMIFKREGFPIEMWDILVKFPNYRQGGGVKLPFKWSQDNEIFDVTNYEINPANIGEKFQNQTVMVRTAKPDSK